MKTAVEWLENEFQEMCKDFGGMHSDFILKFEQAKAMEKKQKIEFAEKMRLIQDVDFDGNITFAFDPRTHLETFKSE